MNEENDRLSRRNIRERSARKEAERLLEEKSSELFASNQKLAKLTNELELRITQRTEELERNHNAFAELNRTFLSLGTDFDSNINQLTQTCGELLGADFALYNRLEGGCWTR